MDGSRHRLIILEFGKPKDHYSVVSGWLISASCRVSGKLLVEREIKNGVPGWGCRAPTPDWTWEIQSAARRASQQTFVVPKLTGLCTSGPNPVRRSSYGFMGYPCRAVNSFPSRNTHKKAIVHCLYGVTDDYRAFASPRLIGDLYISRLPSCWDGQIPPLRVFDVAVIPAEIELREIAVKMLF